MSGVRPGSDQGQTGVRPGSDRGQTGVRPLAAFVWALVALLTLATSAPSAGPFRTLGPSDPADQSGPSRIISLVPAVTEMLFAIGAGDQIVGVSSYEIYPPEAKKRPSMGALFDPDVERILAAKSDLVIVYGSQTELMSRLQRASVPMFRYEHAGLADITSTIRALGDRVGRGARAREVAASIERDLNAIRQSVAGKPRPKTALLFGREPGALRNMYASGGVGFMHDMLELVGGIDAFADVKRQNLQATTEILLARAPEVIIEVHPAEGWTPERIVTERAVWKGLPSLPAVRTGRIHILTDDRLIVPGPRVAEGAKLLASVLHAAGR